MGVDERELGKRRREAAVSRDGRERQGSVDLSLTMQAGGSKARELRDLSGWVGWRKEVGKRCPGSGGGDGVGARGEERRGMRREAVLSKSRRIDGGCG